jgi:hypothetical protein
MKKLIFCSITAFLLLTVAPVHSEAKAKTKTTPVSTAAEAVEAEVLLKRLDEIKAMDLSSLSPAEKKELRNEVRDTKKTLRANHTGVYLSVGAIIIIVLLLILLL